VISTLQPTRAISTDNENHQVKKCMGDEVEGVKPKGGAKQTWSEVEEKLSDPTARQEDDMDCSKMEEINERC